MNTIIALMLVTSNGASEIASFKDMESCMAAKSQIVEHDSFCFQRSPVDIDKSINEMTQILSKMSNGLKKAIEENKNEKNNDNI